MKQLQSVNVNSGHACVHAFSHSRMTNLASPTDHFIDSSTYPTLQVTRDSNTDNLFVIRHHDKELRRLLDCHIYTSLVKELEFPYVSLTFSMTFHRVANSALILWPSLVVQTSGSPCQASKELVIHECNVLTIQSLRLCEEWRLQLLTLQLTVPTHTHTHTHIYIYVSHPTQNRSFRRRSSQPISWLSTEKLKQTQQSKHASVTKYTTT